MPSPPPSSSPGITRLAPLPRRPTGSANGEGGRLGRDVVCERGGGLPHRAVGLQPGPSEVPAASPPAGRVPREPGSPGPPLRVQLHPLPCAHRPQPGAMRKANPRGLAEEAGERFPSPCYGCCRGPCSPGGSGTSRSRPPGNGCRAWCSPAPPPLPPLPGPPARQPPGPPARPMAADPGLAPREFSDSKEGVW